jgi:hypothetical protein
MDQHEGLNGYKKEIERRETKEEKLLLKLRAVNSGKLHTSQGMILIISMLALFSIKNFPSPDFPPSSGLISSLLFFCFLPLQTSDSPAIKQKKERNLLSFPAIL